MQKGILVSTLAETFQQDNSTCRLLIVSGFILPLSQHESFPLFNKKIILFSLFRDNLTVIEDIPAPI
jgi:hypothetical protein